MLEITTVCLHTVLVNQVVTVDCACGTAYLIDRSHAKVVFKWVVGGALSTDPNVEMSFADIYDVSIEGEGYKK